MEPTSDRARVAGLPGRALFAVAALPVVLRAAWRVRRGLRRTPIEALTGRLRDVPSFAFAWLRRPADLDAVVGRLLPWLPPRRGGRCLVRSLILLDLWTRCGLSPRLHLGARLPGEGVLEAHAWVRTGLADLDRRSGPAGHQEIWSG